MDDDRKAYRVCLLKAVCKLRYATYEPTYICTPYGVYSEQVAVSTWVAGCSIGRVYIHSTYMHSPYNSNTYI